MINALSLSGLQKNYGGDIANGNVQFTSLSINTRELVVGDLFVALKGERFDAHQFLAAAIDGGACGLVVHERLEDVSLPQWIVEDTTLALGYIAQAHKKQFTGQLIAVTGSGGKTTVKGMLLSILNASVGDQVFATHGNLNNHIGVPLSLLSLEHHHQYAVIEMGASAVGEIDYLTHLANPNVALVNNVMPAHVEGFGSIDNIATAKGEVYEGLAELGVAVVNLDDHYASQWLLQNEQRTVITFSVSAAASSQTDVQAINIQSTKDGCFCFTLRLRDAEYPVCLHVLGLHNVANALAASACALALGVAGDVIVSGLQSFSGVAGRLQCLKGVNGSSVIDDSYNANPSSVCAAIDVLADVSAKKILILGDMAELGDTAMQAHQDIGLYGRDKNIDCLLSIGTYTKAASDRFAVNNFHFNDIDLLINAARKMADSNTVFLIKGSRSSRMDRVVQALKQRGDNKC
jgi:UDP-N-acetylmuramoyl-tripeptide--D-alanyl-D-alanine ligase